MKTQSSQPYLGKIVSQNPPYSASEAAYRSFWRVEDAIGVRQEYAPGRALPALQLPENHLVHLEEVFWSAEAAMRY